VRSAASQATDVTLLINNAGVLYQLSGLESDHFAKMQHEIEVNYYGVIRMTQAFAPVLKHNGGGMLVNVASIASLVNFPMINSYSSTKAAVHSLSIGYRAALGEQNTHVMTVHPGPIETDMTEGLDLNKASPQTVAEAVLEGIAQQKEEVFPDPTAQQLYEQWEQAPKTLEKQMAQPATS
jgi:short-subunit dehydrogenase